MGFADQKVPFQHISFIWPKHRVSLYVQVGARAQCCEEKMWAGFTGDKTS